MDAARLEPKIGEASRLIDAMANPKRLLVLCYLVAGDLTVGELGERLGIRQSTLSQHLSKLRAWGIVEGSRDGQSVRYRLVSGPARQVIAALYAVYCDVPKSTGKRAIARNGVDRDLENRARGRSARPVDS